MGEMKGAFISMIITVAFILPLFLQLTVTTVHQHSYLKVTGEVTEIIKEEGGVTPKVNEIVGKLSDRGYTITFTDEDGNAVTGIPEWGTEITVKYDYEYTGVYQDENKLSTESYVISKRR